MNRYLRTSAVACALLVAACGRPAHNDVPDVVCGTPVKPALTRSLVRPAEPWREYSRVDRSEAVTAPCLVYSGKKVLLKFRFSWRPVATDLMYLAQGTGTVSGISEPRSVESPYATLVGTDGAISQTPCKTRGGRYFTLTLQLPQVRLGDRGRRADIEAFMRAYFPATVATLGCGT